MPSDLEGGYIFTYGKYIFLWTNTQLIKNYQKKKITLPSWRVTRG